MALASTTLAVASPPPLALKTISASQITAPVGITNAGDGSKRLFICDQVGKIWIISDEMQLTKAFLDLSPTGTNELITLRSGYDERGLLSMAFHPGFANSTSPGYGKFYVFYSAPSPNAPGTVTNPVCCRSTVSEFQVSATDPNVADPTKERVVISWDKPGDSVNYYNHNGGQLAFGPEVGPNGERYLYITVGDGGSQHDNDYGHTGGHSPAGIPIASGNLGNAQDTTKLLGKILRIDPLGNNGPTGTYGIPVDNPFATTGGGVCPEIYSFGMRNPWRLSFDNDPVNGWRLIEGDVGQDNVEEINLIINGGNYGWRIKEGTLYHDSTAPSGGGTLIDPVAEYRHIVTTNAAISSLTPGSSCTVITPTAHNLTTGTNVTLSHIAGGSFTPSINGTYAATVTSPTQFTVPVNCTSAGVAISSIGVGNPCTVTTLSNHNLSTGMTVTFSGLIGGSFLPASPGINNTYTVTYVSPTQFTIPLNCTSACVAISSILPTNPCIVTTPSPHNLVTGTSITISGVNGGNFSPASPGINSTFAITVNSPTQFTVPVTCTTAPTSYNTETGLASTAQKSLFTFSNGTLPPIGTAIIGGYVYRGSAIPGLTGYYVFADYSPGGTGASTGAGLLLTMDASTWALSQPVVTAVTEPVVAGTVPFYAMAMGQDEDGELYLATEYAKGPVLNGGQPSGTIYKIVTAQSFTITLAPIHDNTMFSESPTYSNALGNIYAGETEGGALRRGLLQFDIADNVPVGSVITSAKLSLNMNLTSASGPSNMSLYKLTQAWGEGTSYSSNGAGVPATNGDATWNYSFYPGTTWALAGGTVLNGVSGGTPSATTSVGTTNGYYTWSSAQLAADITYWLGTPANNFGWLLVGNETASQTAHRFDSRESAADVQPALQITYLTAPLTWRETWLQTYFSPIGTYVADLADPSGGGLNNLLSYALALSPLVPNPPESGSQITATSDGVHDMFTITFRRDPRATDLTYQLQTSSDLTTWNTIAQSAGGAVSTGSGFVSENPATGAAPLIIVTAQEVLPSPANRFSRLVVTRTTNP
jgi:glucose/arabinose dehydrogenase